MKSPQIKLGAPKLATTTTNSFKANYMQNIHKQRKRRAAIAIDPLQPVITEQPQDQSVTVGDTATFTVAATVESGTLTHQWEADTGTGFVDIPTETSATLSFPLVALIDNGKIVRARVSANGRSAVSRAALLTITI